MEDYTTFNLIKEILEKKDIAEHINEGVLNIIGIRKKDKDSTKYEDLILSVKITKPDTWKMVVDIYEGTTTPSDYWLRNFAVANKGAAILHEGWHEESWGFGYHKQDPKRPALVQIKPLPVYRDSNKDTKLDEIDTTIETKGLIGINFHARANFIVTELIGDTSAGCQVFKNRTNFEKYFIQDVRDSVNKGIKSFSYNLIMLPAGYIEPFYAIKEGYRELHGITAPSITGYTISSDKARPYYTRIEGGYWLHGVELEINKR